MHVARSFYMPTIYQYVLQKWLTCKLVQLYARLYHRYYILRVYIYSYIIRNQGNCFMPVGMQEPLCTIFTGQENSNLLFSLQSVLSIEFPLIFGETNFVKVPKINEICKICSHREKGALRYVPKYIHHCQAIANHITSHVKSNHLLIVAALHKLYTVFIRIEAWASIFYK